MGLSDLLATIRTSWRLLLLSVLLCTTAAIYLTATAVPQYQATARLYVAAQVGEANLEQAYTGGLLSQQRIASYSSMVATDAVVSKVLQRDGTGRSVDAVESKISVSSPLSTVLLDISFTDPDPFVAQKTANEIANEFVIFATALEGSNGANTPPVRVSLVQPAKLSTMAISPKPKRNLAFGLLAGFAIGLAAIVLRRSLDKSIRTVADLQAMGLPLLGAVPEDKSARRQPVLDLAATHTARAEAFRQIRTNLLFLNVDAPVKSLVVTSAIEQEGKSSTTANLAITFAQAGLSVIVVEADLRRPKLAEYLGLEGAVGLTDVLVGDVKLDDALQSWQNGLLTVLPSGALPLNPSELLSSQRAAALVSELEQRFDVVLIDSPPLLLVTDAAVLAASASCAMLVTRPGGSSREDLRSAVTALRNVDARLSGVVLNGAPRGDHNAYSAYHDMPVKGDSGNGLNPRHRASLPSGDGLPVQQTKAT